jgi:Mycobacterium membrane protein
LPTRCGFRQGRSGRTPAPPRLPARQALGAIARRAAGWNRRSYAMAHLHGSPAGSATASQVGAHRGEVRAGFAAAERAEALGDPGTDSESPRISSPSRESPPLPSACARGRPRGCQSGRGCAGPHPYLVLLGQRDCGAVDQLGPSAGCGEERTYSRTTDGSNVGDNALICRVINDPADARRRRRRIVIPVTAGVALCMAALGAWAAFAVRGGERRGEEARVIQLEVTSDAGQVRGIVWRYPDDGTKIHDLGGGPTEPVKTPWSRRLDVKASQGIIVLNVIHDPDSTGATCRILVNGKVMEEQTGVFPHCMTTVQRAFPVSRPSRGGPGA